jgi:hypothetical protein
MLPRWCVPLRAGRELLGYLWVLDADATVTDAQLAKAAVCAEQAVASITRASWSLWSGWTPPSPSKCTRRTPGRRPAGESGTWQAG